MGFQYDELIGLVDKEYHEPATDVHFLGAQYGWHESSEFKK